MKKQVTILTISPAVGAFYAQLLADLFEGRIESTCYSVENNDFYSILPPADLFAVATTSSDMFQYVMSFIPPGSNILLLKVSLQKKAVEQLLELPKGTKAMLVNLSENMAIETIAELHRFGVTNIEFFPVYPGLTVFPDTDLAITPAESRFVPPHVTKVIDIGHRVLSASSITEIALKLGFNHVLETEWVHQYMDELMEYDYSISALTNYSFNMENKFEILLEALDVGIVGSDDEGRVFACNRAAAEILQTKKETALGMQVERLLPFMQRLGTEFLPEEMDTRLLTIGGTYVNASVTPIFRQDRFMGYFITLQRFYDEENKQHKLRAQMLGGGHVSKYTFDDIVGESECMRKTKSIAMKMAKTESSILLTGESGTGKELFAHSIHHSSPRSAMPFVAINCAALPDTLLESELFGYGDGAFTGAKKGGKMGLFEYAHNGTLFLDEIEAMSPNLQVKLLRVLQEKEIMRVGENKIIPVNVRIIAASNENIHSMVEKGTFRKDLYYRLNTLPIDLPPLRARGNDLFLIMEKMKAEVGVLFRLTEEAKRALLCHLWDGNIRELRNMVEYLQFMELEEVDVEDLPDAVRNGAKMLQKKIS